ncbi:hypothetical protein SE15_06870 [Thermanaerothrix daxensis]|uniref:Helicase HerA central domain-containing protein n=1 Tax=Thermanaerothrix daxensis TaxID=869279 RepID=A0A0P6YL90_9CHLR|nr:DUF87 domain-containing protein [Thermanaerothrix daxensis]KPL83395.1 hypothetical protein SE15_06870 [Thermanaerothrix daxensis]
MKSSPFFLGRTVVEDPAQAQPVLYDPDDLTTHGVIVGMTGSGKTGLLIGILEEAALHGIPSIVIDPKGDLTNLFLHFPDLKPEDFEPWIDPESARRENMSAADMAAKTAEKWRNGLSSWGLGRDHLLALQQAVDYVLYSPGSTAAEPVNLLSSFAPPAGLNWEEHGEILRERISATVTALLGLVGLKDLDPLRSREHILLANLIETAWSKGAALDLSELIFQVQTPPFERLGAFPVDRFFPPKDRFELAVLLNNFLASPSFQAWVRGQSMDPQAFLYTPEGRPRMSIFYLAHLSEAERMFFVTLLLANVESWMRTQRGSSGLRALLAFDEIYGYLPPVANPPSRPVLLRLLKQARAFGLGLLLATQNPVDVDYKGLSNAGTWFIGRLQTEQDKERLLDGLQSIEGGVNRAEYGRMISALKPRTFLLHNVHQRGGVQIFSTRWCLNYLAGPLTRAQLSGLKALGAAPEGPALPITTTAPPEASRVPVGAGAAVSTVAPAAPSASPTAPPPLTRTPPAPPAGVAAFFLPPELSLSQALASLGATLSGSEKPEGLIYRPALLFQAEVRYLDRRAGVDVAQRVTCLVDEPHSARIAWEECQREPFDPRKLDPQPLPEARFYPLPAAFTNARTITAAQKDFLDWVYRRSGLRLLVNKALNLYGKPEDTETTFRARCEEAAQQALKDEVAKIERQFETKLDALARRVERQQVIVKKYEDEVGRRRLEELGTGAELLMGLFGGRKRSISSALSKGRMTAKAKAELEAAEKALDALKDEYDDLNRQKEAAIREARERWARAAAEITEITLNPQRKDIFLEISGLAWVPVYVVQTQGQTLEVPAVAQ